MSPRSSPAWLVAAALAGACCTCSCSREDIELVGSTPAPSSLDANAADAAQSSGDAAPLDASLAVDAAACDAPTRAASPKRLEIFVLLENSASMGLGSALTVGATVTCLFSGVNCGAADGGSALTRWDVAVLELKKFVRDPRSDGIALALKYFGTDCDPSVYATPDVPLGTLPEQATAIERSLDNTAAHALTATRPALEGALAFVRARVQQPDYDAHTVIALITDGTPSLFECSDNTIQSVSRVAAQGIAGEPPIPTYAFAVNAFAAGSAPELDEIAQAGGTGQAVLADLTQPGALSQALTELRDREVDNLREREIEASGCHE